MVRGSQKPGRTPEVSGSPRDGADSDRGGSASQRSPEPLLPLSEPVLQILISLADTDMHGYAIIRDVERRTSGGLVLSTSTLYGALQRMMRDELIERCPERPVPELDDARRRYYRITEFGGRVLHAEARRIGELARELRQRSLLPGRS